MNWVLLLVIIVLAGTIINGYCKGFLRIIYSLVAWIVVLAFVLWSVPYIENYLINDTGIYEKIEQHCEEKLREKSEEQVQNTVENTGTQITAEVSDNSDATQKGIKELGIALPEAVLSEIAEKTADATEELLENSGFYTAVSQSMADFIIQGIAFFIALLAGVFVAVMLSGLLGIVSKIPILSGVNRILGLFAGALNGMLLIWIAFYFIAVCSSSEIGTALVSYIYESSFLTTIYENNLVLTIITNFF